MEYNEMVEKIEKWVANETIGDYSRFDSGLIIFRIQRGSVSIKNVRDASYYGVRHEKYMDRLILNPETQTLEFVIDLKGSRSPRKVWKVRNIEDFSSSRDGIELGITESEKEALLDYAFNPNSRVKPMEYFAIVNKLPLSIADPLTHNVVQINTDRINRIPVNPYRLDRVRDLIASIKPKEVA